MRERRDTAKVQSLLANLRQAAIGTENLMPHLVACAEAYCTLGEMCDVLREVFGTHQEAAIL